MNFRPRSFIFIAFTAAAASAISLIGGIGLELVAEKILPLVPLLIAIPGLNDLVGDYASIIAAHHGSDKDNSISRKQLLRAVLKVLGLNIVFLVLFSLALAYLRGYVLEPIFTTKFFLFIAFALIISVIAMFVIASTLQVILRNKNINPDELMIPITTSLSDALVLILVVLAVFTIF